MPLVLKKTIDDATELFLWQTTEELDELIRLAQLSVEEQNRLAQLKSQQRKAEWLGVRALLNHIFNKKVKIKYLSIGKPVTDCINHISISHTSGYVMVVCSNKAAVGADCELVSDRVLRIKERFLNQNELLSLKSNTELQQVLLYWCLKEVLFKIAPKNEIDFRKDVSIKAFNVTEEDDNLTGMIQQSKQNVKARLGYLKHENLIITWGVQTN